MKHIARYLKYAVYGLLAVLAAGSCLREEWNVPTGEVQVTVVFRLPATRTGAAADVENAIKTLRFIIMPVGLIPEGGEPAFFISHTATPEEIEAGTVELSGIPVGQVQILVIANEAALGKDYSTWKNFSDDCVVVPWHEHQKVRVLDEGRIRFPKLLSEMGLPADDGFLGLPMAWQNLDIEIFPPTNPPHPQVIPVELERSVAKIKVVMQNELDSDMNVLGMQFGKFFSDRIFLFREENLDIPTDTEYAEATYTEDVVIPAGGSMEMVLYVYSGQAWKSGETTSPYAIGFKTDIARYPLQSFVRDGNQLNNMHRNTQYNITAYFKPTSVQLDFSVVPWEDRISDVPDFE